MLGLLSLAGLVMFVVGGSAPATADAVASAVDRQELVQGGVTARFDAEIERSHPLREIALPMIGAVRYLALRQGSAGVVVGRKGWLFTDEELRHYPEDQAVLRERLRYVQEVADLLQHRHSAVVVVVVPSKARIAAEFVPSYLERAVFHRRLQRAVEALHAADIPAVNAADVLRPDDFFLRDTHWRPQGAVRVAETVRNVLGDTGDFGGAYRLHQLEAQSLEGDLLSFVPVGPWNDLLGLTSERFRPLDTQGGSAGSGGAGLFDTPEIPIVLVGTSYSADERFGFETALRAALGGDVLNVAEPAGGPFHPMEAYLQGTTIREIPPEVVIWEIPERYLTLPNRGPSERLEPLALDG